MKPDQKVFFKKAQKYYDEMEFSLAIETLDKIDEPDFKSQLFQIRNYDQLALVTKDLSQKRVYQNKGVSIGKKLLATHPKSFSLFSNLGHLYHHMALGESHYNHRALRFYKKALFLAKHRSDKVGCLNNLGNSFQRTGDLHKALEFYNQGYVLSHGKSASILYNLSFVYLKLTDWRNCLKYSQEYMKMAAIFPKNKMQELFQNSIKINIHTATKFLSSFSDK